MSCQHTSEFSRSDQRSENQADPAQRVRLVTSAHDPLYSLPTPLALTAARERTQCRQARCTVEVNVQTDHSINPEVLADHSSFPLESFGSRQELSEETSTYTGKKIS